MEAIGTLAGGIAHDFNNIISAILGNARLAHDDLPVDSRAQESLEEITKSSLRARNLISQILSFSRRQSGEPQVAQAQALPPLIEESMRLLRATLPARIEISTRFEPDLPGLRVDPTQFAQIMLNLGANAAHAMRGLPGTIRIEADAVTLDESSARRRANLPAGRYLRIALTDTGHGMDEATLSRVFEPFFTTKPVDEGTGLGLAVVHGIVRAHGGAIIARSEPGRGSTFEMYFPAVALPPRVPEGSVAPAARLSGTSVVPRATPDRHVAYIDDD